MLSLFDVPRSVYYHLLCAHIREVHTYATSVSLAVCSSFVMLIRVPILQSPHHRLEAHL